VIRTVKYVQQFGMASSKFCQLCNKEVGPQSTTCKTTNILRYHRYWAPLWGNL